MKTHTINANPRRTGRTLNSLREAVSQANDGQVVIFVAVHSAHAIYCGHILVDVFGAKRDMGRDYLCGSGRVRITFPGSIQLRDVRGLVFVDHAARPTLDEMTVIMDMDAVKAGTFKPH